MDKFATPADPELIQRLPLPSHVFVLAGGTWRPGWLIGRVHEEDGWFGMVQYDDDEGTEVTTQVPAARIAAADTLTA
jgi:hypothetical protein